tara:strand:- start:2947 stop:3435 length:489 start_codon:yes stop_codon:yes gene_type:complete
MSNNFSVVTHKKKIRDVNSENEEDYDKYANIIKVIEKFTARICRTFSDKMVESTRKSHRYVVLFKYNDQSINGELLNDTIDGVSTKEILSGTWINGAKRYFAPAKCKSISNRITEYISDKKFNNGIDIVTKQKYTVSIFHYKNKDSVFPNGIIISRDGIIYK